MPASAAADAVVGFLLSRRLLLCVLHTQALQVALRPGGYLIHLMKAVLAYTRLDNFHGISLSSSQTETFRLRVSIADDHTSCRTFEEDWDRLRASIQALAIVRAPRANPPQVVVPHGARKSVSGDRPGDADATYGTVNEPQNVGQSCVSWDEWGSGGGGASAVSCKKKQGQWRRVMI